MKNYVLVLLPLLLLTASCDSRREVKKLESETNQVHDEAMVALAAMKQTGLVLKQQLAATGPDSLTGARRDSLVLILAQIQKASDDMMQWMATYEAPDKLPAAEAEAYLLEQKKRMEQNRTDIKAALEAGKKWIQQ